MCRNLYTGFSEHLAEYGIDTVEQAAEMDPDLGAYIKEAIDATTQSQERFLSYAIMKAQRMLPSAVAASKARAAQDQQDDPAVRNGQRRRRGNPRSPSSARPPVDQGRAASARINTLEDLEHQLANNKITRTQFEAGAKRLGHELPT